MSRILKSLRNQCIGIIVVFISTYGVLSYDKAIAIALPFALIFDLLTSIYQELIKSNSIKEEEDARPQ